MINWKPLILPDQLGKIDQDSYSKLIFIFKHSSRCSISSIAKVRLEDQWDDEITPISDTYLLDVISHRDLSRKVAEQFQVYHESPQLLIIQNGECMHDASHFDISMQEIKDVI